MRVSAGGWWERGAETPADLLGTFEVCEGRLGALVQRDWTASVPATDWTVRATVEHLVDVVGFYTLHLLSESPRHLRVDVRCHDDVPNAAVLDILAAEVRGLAAAAALLPPSTRAYHFHGMADVSGFVALACAELMVHGDDACRGLGTRLHPDADVAGRVVSRLFPWAPTETDPWTTLLWATGRAPLEGYPAVGPGWAYHPAPLEEWDGRPVVDNGHAPSP